MVTLDMIWPVDGTLRPVLAGDAMADDLLEEALAHNVGLSGWPVISRTERHLAASVPVMAETGDGPPWESRAAWADNDLDLLDTLLDERYAPRPAPTPAAVIIRRRRELCVSLDGRYVDGIGVEPQRLDGGPA